MREREKSLPQIGILWLSSYSCVYVLYLSPHIHLQDKLVLKQQLRECKEELQQQKAFCTELGTASCTLLWSASQSEEAIRDILAAVSLYHFGSGDC